MVKQLPGSVEERVALARQLETEFNFLLYVESNRYPDPLGKYEWLIMAGNEPGIFAQKEQMNWSEFAEWVEENAGQFRAGFVCYPSKDGLNTDDNMGFPALAFFKPEFVLGMTRKGEEIRFGKMPENQRNNTADFPGQYPKTRLETLPKPTLSKEEYQIRFNNIRQHLLRGNIYEVNYCQNFEAEGVELDPFASWEKLNRLSPAPFSCLLKYQNAWLLCSSPERFLSKQGQTIVSQPIKGTAKRTGNPSSDQIRIQQLRHSEKERSENIMIVDLVRNDLSVSLLPGTVKVAELCGIYPYARVFQMVSTIQGQLKENDSGVETIRHAFPMGSMTGAPKIKAMEIAAHTENFERGIYSGTVGFFDPSDNFDLNVVIRSIAWNSHSKKLRFCAGSAVTVEASAEAEYEECLLKAETLFECLRNEVNAGTI